MTAWQTALKLALTRLVVDPAVPTTTSSHDAARGLPRRRVRGERVVVGPAGHGAAGRGRLDVAHRRRIDRAGVAGAGVREPRVLAGDQLARVRDGDPAALRPLQVARDLPRDVGRRGAVEVRVLVGVVDEAERAAHGGLAELGRERVARGTGLLAVEVAAAAVEREVQAHAARLAPGDRAVDVGGRHPARCGRVVVGGVGDRVPGVVAEEQVVDLHLEVVALVAEEDPARDPVEHPVAQQLVVALELVARHRHDELFAPVVRVRVDAEEGGVVRPGEQRLPVLVVHGRRRVAERLGRGRVVVGDLHRALQVREGELAGGGERADDAVLRGADRGVEPVGRGRRGVVAQPPDPERPLELGQRGPLGVGERGEIARRAVGVGDVVAEVAGGEDHGLVAGMIGAVVGQPRVGQRRGLGLSRVGDHRVVRRALTRQLGLPRGEAGLAAVGRDQQHLQVGPLARLDLHRAGRGHRDRYRKRGDRGHGDAGRSQPLNPRSPHGALPLRPTLCAPFLNAMSRCADDPGDSDNSRVT